MNTFNQMSRPQNGQKPEHLEFPRKTAFASVPLLLCGLLACKNVESMSQATAMTTEPSNYVAVPPRARVRPDAQYSIGYTVGCPDWMVRIGDSSEDYCVDRFEAHLVEVRDGKEVPRVSSLRPKKGMKLVAKSSPDSYPQSSVNVFQAAEACLNAGKRLCTMHEWKKACMGAESFTYPYGNEEVSGKCNTRKEHILSKLFGPDPKKWRTDDINDPILNIMKGYLEKPGTRGECVSSYGTYDMVGNLHEWISDLVDKRLIASMPYIGKSRPGKNSPRSAMGNGIFMGGFYSSANQNGKGCNYATIAHAPAHYDYSTGFRCCAETDGK